MRPERPGDRAAKRGLADAGRTDEAEDRSAGVGLELSHREELEDPVLDLLDVVVILVEHLARVLEVEVVLGRLVPRQRGDPLEIAAHHPVFRHRGLQALESRELAVGLLAHLLGKLGRVELLAQLGDLRLHLVGLAKLLLDGLELLAQEVLALALVELGLDLRLDLRADRHHLELARQDLRQPAQPLADVDLLEQRLLLLGLEPQCPRDQVREHAGIVDVGDHDLELLGQVGHLLDDVGERLLHVAHQRGQLRGLVDDVGRLGHLRHQVGLGLQPVLDPHPLPALDQDPQRPVGHADHAGDDAEHADRVQILGTGRFCLRVGAGDHRDRAVAAQDVVDQLDAALLPDVERDQHVGEGHGVAQRQHAHALGERRGAGDRDVTGTAAGGPDLDHCFSAGSIGTACLGAG